MNTLSLLPLNDTRISSVNFLMLKNLVDKKESKTC